MERRIGFLIVEDNVNKLATIQKQAVRAGFASSDLQSVATEADALHRIDNMAIEIAVCDIHLTPEERGEGFHILQVIRASFPGSIRICYTGSTANKELAKAKLLGADEVVSTGWAPHIDGAELLWRHLMIFHQVLEQKSGGSFGS